MPFTGRFIAADCWMVDLAARLPPGLRFDVVSCQMAIHYAFESRHRALQALRNAAARLQPGGAFVGTVVDADVLAAKLRAAAPATSFGNAHYRISFDPPSAAAVLQGSPSPFGLRYTFGLEGAIDDLAEFLVPRKALEELGREAGLRLVAFDNFHAFFDRQWARHADLLQRMKVFPPPDFAMPPQEWEVAYLYAAFVFRRADDEGNLPQNRLKAVHPGRQVHTRFDPERILRLDIPEADAPEALREAAGW
mmetsp:Transcript_11595/g.39624  ORF Transcript_11595/g.39624 Transcript_11595/m.39624 type:complete len:250 (+) Transcript_11595:317-1066(+)